MIACIYALVAKRRPTEIRYVGRVAEENPDGRLRSHLREANRGGSTHKNNWIRKVLADGDEVMVITLESGLTWEESSRREVQYIAHYRELGYKLTNMTNGGEGTTGRILSPESRNKIRVANSKRVVSVETREKLRVINTGKVLSDETKAKMSKPRTDEHKNNIRKAALDRSEETKEKMRGPRPNRVGEKRSDETRRRISENRKEYWRQRKKIPDII